METLAIFGGKPVLADPLPITNTIGAAEKRACRRVLDSGVLSDFVGRAGTKFLGGAEVLALEKAFCTKFNVQNAVSFTSATTALDAAVASLGIGPGDEVIVSPYTMHASATAILMNNAIPVFADVERDTFCLDPASVRKCVTPRTKAIMVVNFFGGAARLDELKAIAVEHHLAIIEDNAQSPGGMYHGKPLGTIGDVGVFSLNFHKNIHCGEGGVLVTNNQHIAYRAQLKRNHGEAVLDDLNNTTEHIMGSNYRMSELHAAIATEQLKKLDMVNTKRIALADYLSKRLRQFDFLRPVFVLPNTKHVYYVYPILFDEVSAGISRKQFALAMDKEGFSLNQGVVKPLYLIPLFQNRKIFPRASCPFDCKYYSGAVDYRKGICPTTEALYENELLLTSICRHPLTKKHIDLFITAIAKIAAQRTTLLGFT
jgi:perosamine synthetase